VHDEQKLVVEKQAHFSKKISGLRVHGNAYQLRESAGSEYYIFSFEDKYSFLINATSFE